MSFEEEKDTPVGIVQMILGKIFMALFVWFTGVILLAGLFFGIVVAVNAAKYAAQWLRIW